MAIHTIPSFPFKVGDTLRAKTTDKGRDEEVRIIELSELKVLEEGGLVLRAILRTTKRKRAKRVSARFTLSNKGWNCKRWMKP